MNEAKILKLRAVGKIPRRADAEASPVRGFDQQELRRIGTFSVRQAAGRLRLLASQSASPHLQQQLLELSAQLERHAMQLGAIPTAVRRKIANHG